MTRGERREMDRLAQRVIELEEDARAQRGQVERARLALALVAGAIETCLPVAEQNRVLAALAAVERSQGEPGAALARRSLETALRMGDESLARRIAGAMRRGLLE